jgi:hypothetical protein
MACIARDAWAVRDVRKSAAEELAAVAVCHAARTARKDSAADFAVTIDAAAAAGLAAAWDRTDEGAAWEEARATESRGQADLLRCIFGDVFRQVRIDAAWLTWNAGTVVKLARTIYDEGRWGDLPVLADALMEAGCQDETILEHCRKGPHAKGCFVIDALLGKS